MIIRERERVRGPGCVCVLFFLSRRWDSYCFDFLFFQCVVQCGWRSRKTSIEPSRKKICPNSLFLFVGVSLFFVSSCTISIGTRTHQPLKKKWTKTKSASTQSSLLCSRSHSTAHFFFYSLTVRTPPDYLPYFGSWFMYSRLNVLVVSTMRKKKWAFILFQTFKTFFAIFPFVYFRYMNERQIRCHAFFSLFHYYAYDCAHRESIEKTTGWEKRLYGSTLARLPVPHADIYLSSCLALWYQY